LKEIQPDTVAEHLVAASLLTYIITFFKQSCFPGMKRVWNASSIGSIWIVNDQITSFKFLAMLFVSNSNNFYFQHIKKNKCPFSIFAWLGKVDSLAIVANGNTLF
jgi:hypothetical protein